MYAEEIREQALSLLQSGLTPLEVSRAMGGRPSRTVISAWAKGVVPSGHRQKRSACTYLQKVAAIQRMGQGEDYRAIAQELGCAPTTLLAWRRQYARGGEESLKTREEIRREIDEQVRQRLADKHV